ncbi:MAG: class I SAM-dependent methyltransferase [bacterium]|nr:class I SAM-dependent methyltransferase [bacterium]
MTGDGASRTALVAALMRAVHRRTARPPLVDDPWAARLVSAEEQAELARRILDAATPDVHARLAALDDVDAILDATLPRHPTYGGVVLRSRVAEDALADAVARGAGQYVLVGAGFDSFCVRQPGFARGLAIFEIDHPATQAAKRERLAACDADVPANVRFVAADLAREPLAAVLGRCGFSATVPAFFSWLGVTIYLPRDANLATLRGVATAAAGGSELVFTYTDQRVLDARPPALEAQRARLAAAGEPWVSGFDPTTLARELAAVGLFLVEDLGPRELAARWCAGRSDGLTPGRIGHVARARVPR